MGGFTHLVTHPILILIFLAFWGLLFSLDWIAEKLRIKLPAGGLVQNILMMICICAAFMIAVYFFS